jgi:hypothetical protein
MDHTALIERLESVELTTDENGAETIDASKLTDDQRRAIFELLHSPDLLGRMNLATALKSLAGDVEP